MRILVGGLPDPLVQEVVEMERMWKEKWWAASERLIEFWE